MVHRYNERVYVTKIKQVHSMLDKILTYAQIEKGPITTWDIGNNNTSQGANKIYQILRPYMDVSKDCNNTLGQCFSSNQYKLLNGRNAWFSPSNNTFRTIMLKNGVAIGFWSDGNTNCRKNSNTRCFNILVDLNGSKAPNKAGVDLYDLMVFSGVDTSSGLGYLNLKKLNSISCNKQNTDNHCGIDCWYWVLYKGNMDYLRRDISNE